MLLVVSFASQGAAEEAFICVWRNPERTMTRLFPKAKDYKTKTVAISAQKLETIENRIDTKVLQGQREQFQYFEMTNATGEVIGYTLAVTQKGEFGAIEFVFGLDTNYTLKGMYIQRARERNREFKKKSFLAHFKGSSVNDAEQLQDPLKEKGNIGTKAVITGVKKAMVSFDELVIK